jgi:hypothetical protein
MTTHVTIDPPTLDGFETHYGIPVAILGEDGDQFVALGRHDKRRVLAAFNRMCRVDLGWRNGLSAEFSTVKLANLRYEQWVLATDCGDCGDNPECTYCAEIRSGRWWLRMATDRDAEAFPVTVWIA